MTLQTVILAAGMGSRLGRSLPKPLTELNDGRSIMRQQHDNIRAAFGAEARITTVVGYRAETIVEAFPEVDYVYNDRYDQTNTSKSLLRALNATGRHGVLWMNGDVVFDPRVLGRAIALIEGEQSFVTVNTAKVSDEEGKYTVTPDGFIRELSKTVTGGLGGIDVYLYAGTHRYALRDGVRLLEAAKVTPVVDGSGLKNTLEREAVRFMQDDLGMELRGKHVLMVSALDRFGLAQALVDAGADVLFGDFIFALDLDKPVRGLKEFEQMAEKYLPDACKLPFQFFYPTGKKQDKPPEPKYPQYYEEADIIAGDFHFMRQFMPDRLDGKIVLTNTVTATNIEELRSRGIAKLITTTPDFEGRSFGTNVIEAALLALLGKTWNDVKPEDYERVLHELHLHPRVVELN